MRAGQFCVLTTTESRASMRAKQFCVLATTESMAKLCWVSYVVVNVFVMLSGVMI